MKKNYGFIFFILFVLTSNIVAQSAFKNTISFDPKKGSPKADLSAIQWIAGHWEGKLSDTEEAEEIWSPPMAGSMMGVFKWISKGEVQFYEILTLVEKEGTLLLQLKHFAADLKGWEEKEETVDFKLVKVTPNKVYFDDFTFEKINNREINIYVVFDQNGNQTEHKFNYHKVDLPAKQADTWQTVLKTDKSGKVIAGNKEVLINAIRQGLPVKIAWGAKGKTHTIEHVATPIWLAILDELEVVAHLEPQILAHTDWEQLTADYANPSKLKEEWRVVISTKGAFDAVWYDRGTNKAIKRVPQNHPITWMVIGRISTNKIPPLYKE